MNRRAAATWLRRLCRTLLLPLLLVCVQQGAFLHELSHYKPAQAQEEGDPQKSTGPCELCLAFAGVQSVAASASLSPLLLTGLSFALMAVMVVFVRAATPPALRNRGPPVPR